MSIMCRSRSAAGGGYARFEATTSPGGRCWRARIRRRTSPCDDPAGVGDADDEASDSRRRLMAIWANFQFGNMCRSTATATGGS